MSCDVITRMLLIKIIVFSTISNARVFEYRLIQSNNIQRQELLQQKCDKYHYVESNDDEHYPKSIYELSEMDMEHLLIDRSHKFLYCYVPKVIHFIYFTLHAYSLSFGWVINLNLSNIEKSFQNDLT